MNIYYVYIYFHPLTNIPFYVGFGKNERKYDHLNEAKKTSTNSHKLNTIRKILRGGMTPIIQLVDENLTRATACELEEFLIQVIGRADQGNGPLTNLTKGGDGNRDWTPPLREKMSRIQKNYIQAKDLITNKKIKIHKDDPRWISGDLVGQNYREVNSNRNGKLDGYILAKNPTTDEHFRIKPEDPRWVSGELVGINKDKDCHENTRLAAIATHKGKPKSTEHIKKVADTMKLLKWYCNFSTGEVGRFRENEQPAGYVRVSGPHKREPIS